MPTLFGVPVDPTVTWWIGAWMLVFGLVALVWGDNGSAPPPAPAGRDQLLSEAHLQDLQARYEKLRKEMEREVAEFEKQAAKLGDRIKAANDQARAAEADAEKARGRADRERQAVDTLREQADAVRRSLAAAVELAGLELPKARAQADQITAALRDAVEAAQAQTAAVGAQPGAELGPALQQLATRLAPFPTTQLGTRVADVAKYSRDLAEAMRNWSEEWASYLAQQTQPTP